WRLELPVATTTRSNSGERCSVLKTWMSCALTSSRPSTMARWSLVTSFLAAVSDLLEVVIRWSSVKEWNQYSLQAPPRPRGARSGCQGMFQISKTGLALDDQAQAAIEIIVTRAHTLRSSRGAAESARSTAPRANPAAARAGRTRPPAA